MRATVALAVMAAAWAHPAQAQGPLVEGAVYRERDAGGERLIEPAGELRRGDRVVLLVRWQAAGDRDGFVVTTPVPPTLAYRRDSSDAVEVSTDGGRSWTRTDRLAGTTAGQVTHLRWRVGASQAAQGSGSFAYSAIVR